MHNTITAGWQPLLLLLQPGRCPLLLLLFVLRRHGRTHINFYSSSACHEPTCRTRRGEFSSMLKPASNTCC